MEGKKIEKTGTKMKRKRFIEKMEIGGRRNEFFASHLF